MTGEVTAEDDDDYDKTVETKTRKGEKKEMRKMIQTMTQRRIKTQQRASSCSRMYVALGITYTGLPSASLERKNLHNLKSLFSKATVRTGHGPTNWFQIGKGVRQGCILSPCLLNLYAEYIMRNTGLEEAQAGIKIAGRNINNLRYADGTTVMAESEEDLKSLLMKVKEESEKAGLKLDIQKTKVMASPHGK